MTQTATQIPAFRNSHKESPLGLFIAVISERPAATEREHKKRLRQLLLSSGYEEFLDSVIAEWQSIKYSAAYRAANPPTIQEVRLSAANRRAAVQKQASATESAKLLIGGRLLDLIAPNGKAMRDCTGADCIKFGGFYARIGKKVGPRQIVGKVLTAEDVAGIWKDKKAA